MGLGYHVVEALIREARHRPIDGEVVLIGRQTVYFSPEGVFEIMINNGLAIDAGVASGIRIDRSTINRRRHEAAASSIADVDLFRLLGTNKVRALDHSDYEGAEIVHDLTKPIPDSLRACADFIVDGSTLDNVFDPVSVISNYAEMLRPGGRLIATNAMTEQHDEYVLVPPLWYLDYFTMNGFSDCKVYIVTYGPEHEGASIADVFTINLDALLDPSRKVSSFRSDRQMTTVVLAEKGLDSTSHVRPSQQHYRSEEEWETYRSNLARIKGSERHHLVRTHHPITMGDVRGGHLFMAADFSARDPWTEYQKTLSEPAVTTQATAKASITSR